ncbi:MAG: lipid-binding SYLF domain-containing protein [bacterium]
MKKLLAFIAAAAFLPFVAAAADKSSEAQRLDKSAEVLREAKQTIPADMLARAQCIAVLPDVKRGAFIFGATYGAGFASCRTQTGWSPPAGISMQGGSVGLQAGGSSADYVILVMGQNARDRLLNNDLKFDARASAALGTTGPSTDETGQDVVVWARSGGAFAGVDVNGARLTQDSSANEKLYGHKVPNSLILEGQVQAPPASRSFEQALPRRSR